MCRPRSPLRRNNTESISDAKTARFREPGQNALQHLTGAISYFAYLPNTQSLQMIYWRTESYSRPEHSRCAFTLWRFERCSLTPTMNAPGHSRQVRANRSTWHSARPQRASSEHWLLPGRTEVPRGKLRCSLWCVSWANSRGDCLD